MNQKNFVAKKDFLIIGGILLLAVGLFFLFCFQYYGKPNLYVQISQADETLYYAPLHKNHTFTLPENHKVVIQIEQGEAWFLQSDCPDQVCVKSGVHTTAGSTAACLPNRVILTIIGEDTTALDAIT